MASFEGDFFKSIPETKTNEIDLVNGVVILLSFIKEYVTVISIIKQSQKHVDVNYLQLCSIIIPLCIMIMM